MRRIIGQSGHGISAVRRSGGIGSNSILVHLARALAIRGAEAIGAGVAAAQDHDASCPWR